MSDCHTYYKSVRKDMLHYLPERYGKVLEIGCGAGVFRKALIPGCEYQGIEPSDMAVREAREQGLSVLHGTFDDVAHELPNAHYDLVVCNDVIEHMVNPAKFLTDIKRKMAPQGVIVGSYPNIRHLFALKHLLWDKDWRYRDLGVFDRTHLRFFTMKSFARMVIEQGYTIETMSGIYWGKFTGWHKYAFCLFYIPAVFLGFDTPYSQIGFRIRPSKVLTAENGKLKNDL